MRVNLGTRKLVVFILIGSIFLLANVWFIVKWLDENGVVTTEELWSVRFSGNEGVVAPEA